MPRKGTDGSAARSFDALARLAREAGDGHVSDALHVAGRARLVAAVEKERGHHTSRVVVMRTTYAVAAMVVIAIGAWGVERYRAPEWTVEGAVAQSAPSAEGAFVQSPAAADAVIHFTDGSAVKLAKASRARVSRGGGGHHVVLEDGRAEVKIAHGASLAFAFDAGPFTVKATQGSMALAWSGGDEQLEVAPTDGAALVKGGLAGEGLTVNGGDKLTAKVKSGELQITRADGAVTTSIAPSALPSAAPPPAAPTLEMDLPATPPPAVTAAAATHLSWSAMVAKGDYDSVLKEADAMGVDGAIAKRPLGDLAALADASRYKARTDVARRALTAERSRFPGSKEAHTAAFLLGRLAEDQEQAPAKAIPWYDRYLKEAPSGPFASDALGRKMVCVQHTQGPDAARPIAEQYARRFPHGAYSGVAEELMSR
jgi:hypothetical protein